MYFSVCNRINMNCNMRIKFLCASYNFNLLVVELFACRVYLILARLLQAFIVIDAVTVIESSSCLATRTLALLIIIYRERLLSNSLLQLLISQRSKGSFFAFLSQSVNGIVTAFKGNFPLTFPKVVSPLLKVASLCPS